MNAALTRDTLERLLVDENGALGEFESLLDKEHDALRSRSWFWGKSRDLEDISDGNSDLDDLLGEAAQRQGRVLVPNSKPERGSFYRADNFEFSKFGVPSLYPALL